MWGPLRPSGWMSFLCRPRECSYLTYGLHHHMGLRQLGVQGYDEDQIALVIPDLSDFAAWVPVISETPMISHIMNVIKEKEIDALATPWVYLGGLSFGSLTSSSHSGR